MRKCPKCSGPISPFSIVFISEMYSAQCKACGARLNRKKNLQFWLVIIIPVIAISIILFSNINLSWKIILVLAVFLTLIIVDVFTMTLIEDEKRRKSKLPKPVVIGFTLFFTAKLYQIVSGLIDPEYSTMTRVNLFYFSELLENMGLALAFGSMIIYGIYTLRKAGITLKYVSVVVLGIMFCAGHAWYSYAINQNIFDMHQMYIKSSDDLKENLEAKLAKDSLILEKRAKLSQQYAKMQYEDEGILIEHVTPEGATTIYKPSPEAETNRIKYLRLKTQSRLHKKSSVIYAWIWVVTGVIALLIGTFNPIQKEGNIS